MEENAFLCATDEKHYQSIIQAHLVHVENEVNTICQALRQQQQQQQQQQFMDQVKPKKTGPDQSVTKGVLPPVHVNIQTVAVSQTHNGPLTVAQSTPQNTTRLSTEKPRPQLQTLLATSSAPLTSQKNSISPFTQVVQNSKEAQLPQLPSMQTQQLENSKPSSLASSAPLKQEIQPKQQNSADAETAYWAKVLCYSAIHLLWCRCSLFLSSV